MGKIIFSRIDLFSTLSETIGYKSGVALSKEEIIASLPEYKDLLEGIDDDVVGVRSEILSDIVIKLLYKVGSISSPNPSTPGMLLHKKYSGNPEYLALLPEIIKKLSEYISENQPQKQEGELLDLNPFMQSVLEKYGRGAPIKVALDCIESIQFHAYTTPWSEVRYVNWENTVELSQLFKSESLDTYYGHFFDQRFIDYLNSNFEAIDKIHWRQFEGLTAEFYTREGFHVNIGPGRDDGSIDARIYPTENDVDKPPLILVQCKRQKEKIGKVVVKALWADIQAEKAQSGLIVTTHSLSPGAEKVSQARSYPISVANRQTLREWLMKMRSPYTGIFLSE